MMDSIFDLLQRIGRAFMLPIAILPIAGIMLGVGGVFTFNDNIAELYHLSFLEKGGFLFNLLVIIRDTGLIFFSNLSALFALGVAVGLAKQDKGTAGVAAFIGFFVFHKTISGVLTILGQTPSTTTVQAFIDNGFSATVAQGLAAGFTNEIGIFTLQVGTLGGILVGCATAFIHNRTYQISLPASLSFFSGSRFVPIATTGLCFLLGLITPFIWPYVFNGVVKAGELFSSLGFVGDFLYGFSLRILNVFGLHHAIYPLFWFTELGGHEIVNGVQVAGGQKIFFAQLADPNVVHYSSQATRFFMGGYLPMMFGLPAAALAMYHASDKEKRPLVGGLLFSAALTSFLTGITEPIEFTFLFVAPALYVIHAILEGIAYAILPLLNVAVGVTFSRGIIDFIFFGVLQGAEKTSYYWILILGPIWSVLYYFIFSFMIRTFNYKTPGREGAATKLYSKSDYKDKKNSKALNLQTNSSNDIIFQIVEALGGIDNIDTIDACITRLRVTVKDTTLVKDDIYWKEQLDAKGLFRKGNGVQVIYGAKADNYKNEILSRFDFQ